MSAVSASWKQLASSSRLQRSSQSVTVIGSQALIFGGELQPRQPVDSQIDVIDTGAGVASTLSAPATAPTPRVGATSVAVNGALYVFSGRGGLEMKPVEEDGALWCYSPAESTWTQTKPADASAPFPAGRSYHASTSDGADLIFIYAGCPESGRLCDLWSFSLSSKTWTQYSSGPEPGRGGASMCFSDGKIYCMNGFDGKTEQGGIIDVFDLTSKSWDSIKFQPDGLQGPEPRSVCTLLATQVSGKKMLVTMFGEHDPSALGHAGAGKMLGNAWAFDIAAKTWSKIQVEGETPAPRGWFDADVVSEEGKEAIVVHGGLAEDNSRLGDVWKMSFI